jgi:hypothetical protein
MERLTRYVLIEKNCYYKRVAIHGEGKVDVFTVKNISKQTFALIVCCYLGDNIQKIMFTDYNKEKSYLHSDFYMIINKNDEFDGLIIEKSKCHLL